MVTDVYPSSTFNMGTGILYGSNITNSSLDVIDPCTCLVTPVGPTNFGSLPGITANGLEVSRLFGVEVEKDILLTLNTTTGAGTEIGPLGLEFHFTGTTWSSDVNGLFSIEDTSKSLYTVNTGTGAATKIADINTDIRSVGIEWHKDTKELYMCTDYNNIGKLYSIDVTNGDATEKGGLPYNCNNLASPWTTISCVDDVPFN